MRGVNWGCLLAIAACIAVDAAVFAGARALAIWLIGA